MTPLTRGAYRGRLEEPSSSERASVTPVAGSVAVMSCGTCATARPTLSLPGLIRPVLAQDLGPLMASVGVVVDGLYPAGALKLQQRLGDALNGYATAYVVTDLENRPIALAAETPKGLRSAKLSTFWVHPSSRGRGVGKTLLTHRQSSWVRAGYERVHVTVREERAQELERLFLPQGFERSLVVLDRYGEGSDEVVLTWRPDGLDQAAPAGIG